MVTSNSTPISTTLRDVTHRSSLPRQAGYRPWIVGLRVRNPTERFFVHLASSTVAQPELNVIAFYGREIRRMAGGSATMLDTASEYQRVTSLPPLSRIM